MSNPYFHSLFCKSKYKIGDSDVENAVFTSDIPNRKKLISVSTREDITEYEIPDDVVEIGANAFKDNIYITTIIFNNGLEKIGDDAFHGCTGISSVNLPISLVTIGERAFDGCTSLTSVQFAQPNGGESNKTLSTIDVDAFKDCPIESCNIKFDNSEDYVLANEGIYIADGALVVITNKVPATCENTGYYEGVKYYTQKKGEISELPSKWNETSATGHKWTGSYDWSDDYSVCTAYFVCTNDGTHTGLEECTVTSITTAADCKTEGKTVYTAKVTFDGKEYTDIKEKTLPATGHDWNEPSFSWSEDNSCTATFTCKNNADHKEVKTCTITNETNAATCDAPGTVTYTATITFGKKEYSDSKSIEYEENIGHDWKIQKYIWSDDYSTCTAKLVCSRDQNHTDSAACTITSVTREATCKETGSITYTATVKLGGNSYSEEKEVEIPKLTTHTPGTEETDPNSIVKATCLVDGKHETVIKCLECGKELGFCLLYKTDNGQINSPNI